MTIDLKPEKQRVIELAVRSGAYQNASEVLDQAFEIIREQLDLRLDAWATGGSGRSHRRRLCSG
jgi:Arc/MetJ-type ribon-helix-helix transcriptional regulator